MSSGQEPQHPTQDELRLRLRAIGERLLAEHEHTTSPQPPRSSSILSDELENSRTAILLVGDFHSRQRTRPPNLSFDSASSGVNGSPMTQRVTRNQSLDFNARNSGQPTRRAQSTDDHLARDIRFNSRKLTFKDGVFFSSVSPKDLKKMGDLGTGTCGHVVKMMHDPSRRVMAVKQMRKSGVQEENNRIYMDLNVVLKCTDCPYIVHCYGYFLTDSDVWICMELMDSCLEKLQRRRRAPVPEEILGYISVSVLKALHYLKTKHDVIHRDVKPSNILLDKEGNIKLCDFGIAGRLVDSKVTSRDAGVAGYIAPERVDPARAGKQYDVRADVWSLGIALVELAKGQHPYAACKTDFELLVQVMEKDPPCLERSEFSDDFCQFVSLCLTKDYRNRPKYVPLLSHPFILKHDVDTAKQRVADWFNSVS